MAAKSGFLFSVKEFFRKQMVKIKRRPNVIPLFMLLVCCLELYLSMGKISYATWKIYGANMGLISFVGNLFSILVLVTFMNAFPKRKKVKVVFLVLTFLMIGIIVTTDIIYISATAAAVNSDIERFGNDLAILAAYNSLIAHLVLLAITVLLIVFLPLYTKLLRKINTSIEIDSGVTEFHTLEKID